MSRSASIPALMEPILLFMLMILAGVAVIMVMASCKEIPAKSIMVRTSRSVVAMLPANAERSGSLATPSSVITFRPLLMFPRMYSPSGMPEGEYILGNINSGLKVITEEGVAKLPDRSAFAGSIATTDRLVRTMIDFAGISLHDAITMMTATPARIINMNNRIGSIKAGMDADLLIFDGSINVQMTMVKGRIL